MMKKDYKYIYLADHLKSEAMKIHKKKWSDFKMGEMNFEVEVDNITGLQKNIIGVTADGPEALSKLLSF